MKKEEISKSEIPEGIIFCIKNGDRFFEDAVTLGYKEKYSSALLLMMLAMEELGKANLLLHHFEQKEDVPKGEVNIIL